MPTAQLYLSGSIAGQAEGGPEQINQTFLAAGTTVQDLLMAPAVVTGDNTYTFPAATPTEVTIAPTSGGTGNWSIREIGASGLGLNFDPNGGFVYRPRAGATGFIINTNNAGLAANVLRVKLF